MVTPKFTVKKAYSVKLAIVDDSSRVRESLRKIAEGVGRFNEILEASSVATAKSLMQSELPAILVLDYEYPDGTALDILKAVPDEGYDPVIIVITILHNNYLRAACLKAGANYVFNKSTDLRQLKIVLRSVTT